MLTVQNCNILTRMRPCIPVVVLDVSAAAIKEEALRVALASAGRACPEWEPCDTASGEIPSGRGGKEGGAGTAMPLPLEERSSIDVLHTQLGQTWSGSENLK